MSDLQGHVFGIRIAAPPLNGVLCGRNIPTVVVVALSAAILGHASAEPQSRSYESKEKLVVQASVITAGPHGEICHVELTPDGELSVEVLVPNGKLKGSFVFQDSYWDDLRRLIDEEQFFQLSPVISRPSARLHRPDLAIEVSLGGNAHKVSLYDPESFRDHPECGAIHARVESAVEPTSSKAIMVKPHNLRMERTWPFLMAAQPT